MIVSSLPIWLVDMLGAVLMIIFSFLCLRLARGLRRRDPHNVIWTYLFWVCVALSVFAISRSAGHILKQILLMSGHDSIWHMIGPFSGAINSLTFVVVGAVTLFFERSWKVYQQIMADKQQLQAAHEELVYLNQNLENLAMERTAELARSEHKYRRIFEVSRDMILVADTEGRIMAVNPAGLAMLGFKDWAALSENGNFTGFFVNRHDWQQIRQTIVKQGFVMNAEVDLKRRDGAKMRALLSGSLDQATAGENATIHFLVKDIEQKRLMEQQMAQADKLASIGQLSAGIAHEINNPLGIILGYTQLLIRNDDQGTERYQDLRTIEKHVRNCKSIVEDLLSFARSSKPEKEKVHINKALEEVVNFIQHHARLEAVQLERSYGADIPPLLLDEKKIKQVFMNLIMNAKHAVGDSGAIHLATEYRAPKGQVLVHVSDNGYGIKPKDLPRIFDPFFTTKSTGEGTGLGLSVSYGIVKNHGGDILVESQSGQGSRFTIVLPANSKFERSVP